MYRYVPNLSDGQRVKLSWPLALFSQNHIFWPLDENSSPNWRRFDYFLAVLGIASMVMHLDAEMRFLRAQTEVDDLMTGMPNFLITVEGTLRMLLALFHREKVRGLLIQYFSTIYVDRHKESKDFQRIEKKLRFSRFVSGLYLGAVSGFVLAPITMLIKAQKELLYPMILPFDVNPFFIFVSLTMSSIWVALEMAAMSFGETGLLCELMAHLKARYELVQREMDESIETILKVQDRSRMAQQVREVLVRAMHQHVILNRFNEQLEQHFTSRIFIMFSFSAMLLCGLGYKTYTSANFTYNYPLWFGAKAAELLSLGQLGSDLAYKTEALSSMYYHSQWEQVLYYSTNPRENLRLMRVVTLAIELNYKPFYFTGLSYFEVSIQTVIKILQGAFSYFTFFTSMRDEQEF